MYYITISWLNQTTSSVKDINTFTTFIWVGVISCFPVQGLRIHTESRIKLGPHILVPLCFPEDI